MTELKASSGLTINRDTTNLPRDGPPGVISICRSLCRCGPRLAAAGVARSQWPQAPEAWPLAGSQVLTPRLFQLSSNSRSEEAATSSGPAIDTAAAQ